MRTEADNARLWAALADGDIQTVGTDHCPFFFDGSKPIIYEGKEIAIPGKELGARDFTKIPNGLPGVQDRLPILWTTGVNSGRITPNQFVALTSTNPAKIFGLYPRKGALVPGADADILIWDPAKKVTYGVAHSQQRTDYNLYEGWELTGYPEKVFLRGKLIVDGEQWLGKSGEGQFLKRSPGEVVVAPLLLYLPVIPVIVHQRPAIIQAPGSQHIADKNRMIARFKTAQHPAIETGQAFCQ
jgi:dihydropyrimidinase